MRYNNVNLIYFSPTGNTKKIVEAIGKGTGLTIKSYDLTLIKNRNCSIEFGPEDLVVIGVPVYAGRIPVLMADWMVQLKGQQTPVIMAVVYGNREYEDALIELKDVLSAQGLVGISGAAFVGEHSYTEQVGAGRPDTMDLAEAEAFGRQSAALLQSVSLDKAQLSVRGTTPYKARGVMAPMAPVTSDACTRCGICAAYCPVEAIDREEFSRIGADRCIRCCSCIRKCPVNAKRFDHESILQIRNRLIENCSGVRKPVECFYLEK